MKKPDPHALKIAGAAQAAVMPDIVILFGSRAAGDYRENSDLNILVVADHDDHQESRAMAEQAATLYMEENPPELTLGIMSMTRKEFDRCRQAHQHIAGQAANHGVNMSGERLDHQYDYNDEYPSHWTTTRERIQTAETALHELREDVENNHWNQSRTGHEAEHALENALKAVLSSHNEWGRYRHDIGRAWRKIKELEQWEKPEEQQVRDAVQGLFDHTTYPDPVPGYPERTSDWLVLYAVRYDYLSSSHQMPPEELRELLDKTTEAVEGLIWLTHQRSGTTGEDTWPGGARPWERR